MSRRISPGPPALFEFTAEDQAAMDDLALESQVRAELALDPETSHLEVKIIAQRGAVSISGKAGGGRDIEEARRIAERVPGVISVDVAGLEPVARA